MYRLGHYGSALLVYAPLGFGLVLADLPDLAVLGGALSLGLAPVPDYDQQLPLVSHRGVTHTFLFAGVVGGVFAGLGWAVGASTAAHSALVLAAFGGLVGTTGILSHLLADIITPAGIAPLWPLSGRTHTLDIVRADNTLANYLLLGLGVLAVTAVAATATPLR
ncbi:metal-dependent hydrolase [Halomicroarcula sp. GCM10025709]|uniref:metal-dependent hydrolase n=1 Tax=Haloarcula TaxID=2237 RepID=UPI0024C2888E|nr:metal-dependent hydrolase [Halomicroarcula sp. YJ-61-S]